MLASPSNRGLNELVNEVPIWLPAGDIAKDAFDVQSARSHPMVRTVGHRHAMLAISADVSRPPRRNIVDAKKINGLACISTRLWQSVFATLNYQGSQDSEPLLAAPNRFIRSIPALSTCPSPTNRLLSSVLASSSAGEELASLRRGKAKYAEVAV